MLFRQRSNTRTDAVKMRNNFARHRMRALEATKSCLTKYATFSGRSSCSEFWWFYLITGLIQILLSSISVILVVVLYFGLICPILAVSFRRMADVGMRHRWVIFILAALMVFLGAVGPIFPTSRQMVLFELITMTVTGYWP